MKAASTPVLPAFTCVRPASLRETYKGMRISPKVTPLLEISHPDGDRYVAWVSPYQPSRVVAVQLGHDERAHRSVAYRELVRNAIVWSARR